jgi:hypothetical protein
MIYDAFGAEADADRSASVTAVNTALASTAAGQERAESGIN